jgi:guanosine-3',5'-bis(diphosphate) 3'-pyrophosphohydrolase
MNVEEFISSLDQYKGKLDISLIAKACEIADLAHKNQKRKSGLPYIIHPINIANDLIKYNFDTTTIIAGLLHDVVEDTEIKEDELAKYFSQEVIYLVNGVTKLGNIRFFSNEEAKIENFRKFILAVVQDIRVLIVKLFDRLDNMRSIMHIPQEEKRRRISRETIEIYTPLAERIGLYDLKDELEELCFSVLEPAAYQVITQEVNKLTAINNLELNTIKRTISDFLSASNIECETQVRIKKPYSIWKKIKKDNISFDQIFDILGFRVITNNVEECYRVLFVLHSKYKAITGRCKDYISSPKFNDYKSLHTAIYYEGNTQLDIQIRTQEMHKFAENGIAAHWNYKNPTDSELDVNRYAWLRSLLNLVNQQDIKSEDFFEYSKMELYADQIFALTPKGTVISLPADSCALDFAYSIHTNLGNKASKVLINGVEKTLFTKLENGQKVEISADPNQEPKADWLLYVKTGIAQHAIKRFLNVKKRQDIAKKAHSLIQYMFEKEKLSFSQIFIPKILQNLNIRFEHTFYEKILAGKIKPFDVIQAIFPNKKQSNYQDNIKVKKDSQLMYFYKGFDYKNIINTDHLTIKISEVLFADCCFPVYGDSIVGVVLPGNKIEIHHSSCEVLYSNSLQNLTITRAHWHNKEDYLFKAKLALELAKSNNIISKILKILEKKDITVSNIELKNSEKNNLMNVIVTIDIESLDNLTFIIDSLKRYKNILSIDRIVN